MAYDPATYWEHRAVRMGPDYVGPGSKANLSALEANVFAAWLRRRVRKHAILLDVGCGSGRLTATLWACTGSYVGIDIAPSAIAMAEQRTRYLPNASFQVVAPGDPLPFADMMFDAVVLSVVLQHVPNYDAEVLISELRRVMDHDASVYIIDAHPDAVPEPHEHMFPRMPSRVARAFGFDPVEVERRGEHYMMDLHAGR